MFIGICTIRLRLRDNHSLKGKRRVVKTITERVKNKFNVSIAEVDHQDLWQRAELGVAIVTNDKGHAHRTLTAVVNFIDGMHLADLLDHEIEML
ncbi:DUF503 domain-containing protein [Nitrospinae bacterium AH_259_B05_G02_I21]|nr:DUF503 domain-containing protein [Nitrospinae bacterium AH_259_B05_G02_I21]MDA2931731.1 DUF503 domain-containing protein [Nitrospinae bacterium AH-259-F20]